MSVIIIIKHECDNHECDNHKCDNYKYDNYKYNRINMIVIIKYKYNNHFKKSDINRDLYIKIMREKIINSCDLIIKNVTHLKKIDHKFSYIFIFIYI